MKLVKYFSYLLLLVSAVLIIAFYAMGCPENMVTVVLNWAYVLLGISILGAVVLPFFFGNGKGVKGTLIKIGSLAVLVVISYLLSSSEPINVAMTNEPTPGQLQFTDATMLLTAFLMGIAVIAIIAGAVMNFIKK